MYFAVFMRLTSFRVKGYNGFGTFDDGNKKYFLERFLLIYIYNIYINNASLSM